MSRPNGLDSTLLVIRADQKWSYDAPSPTSELVESAFKAFGDGPWFTRWAYGRLCEFYVTSIEHGNALSEGVTIGGYFQPMRHKESDKPIRSDRRAQ